LRMRIPEWAQGASVKVNGKRVSVESKPLSYFIVDREWKNGDTVALTLPMRVTVDRWTKQGRQFAVIDTTGKTGVYTGPKATEWAGHKQGKFCTAQGNILAGEGVVAGMVKAFESTTGHLSMRLMAALDAGQAAGGDKRGMQSAAMIIVKKNGGVWLNNDVVLRLQVDDSEEPLKELRRVVEKWNATQRRRR